MFNNLSDSLPPQVRERILESKTRKAWQALSAPLSDEDARVLDPIKTKWCKDGKEWSIDDRTFFYTIYRRYGQAYRPVVSQ